VGHQNKSNGRKIVYNLKIKDFQRFKNQSMEIKGFTVLEGQSNLGKSSIRRALGVVTQNIWEANFVSKGSKNTEITLEADDISIHCIKGSSNEFTILKDGKKVEYKKAGKDIPKELVDSGFSPLTIGKEKINLLIAKQYDPLFMVSYSDQQNTKILNSVFDVDIIEKANELVIKDLASQKRELKRELSIKEEKTKELEQTSFELKKVKQLQAIYDKIELLDDYTDCKEDLNEVLVQFKSLDIILSKLDRLKAIANSFNQAILLKNKLKEYQSLSNDLKALTSRLKLIEINDKLLMLRDLELCVEDKLDNLNDILYVKEDLDKVAQADVIYNNLKLLIAYKKKHYHKHLLDKKLATLATVDKVDLLMKYFDSLLSLDRLLNIQEQIKSKNKELDAVSFNIQLQDEQLELLGLCPCCHQPIHRRR